LHGETFASPRPPRKQISSPDMRVGAAFACFYEGCT
jgi:hypothetical protein